jgi:NodT family efflux transporter outer membrane factor (OMF) lipoprotein
VTHTDAGNHQARLRGLLAAGCIIALAGCNLAPSYQKPATPTPAGYKEAENWQPARPADTIPKGAWWTIYGDHELDDLEAEVDTGNPTLAEASAAYDRARSLAAEARAGMFPSVQLGGNLSNDKESAKRPLRGTQRPTYYGANTIDGQASYEIDLWGRVRDEVAAGRAAAQAGAADLETVRLMLHAEVADNYMALRGLDEEAKLLADTVAAYQQAYELTSDLYAGKIASDIDVTRAETQLHDAEAQVSDIAARRALHEHAIATLIGKPPASLNIAPAVVKIDVPNIPTGLPSTLLERRPDIAAAERQVAASNQLIGVAKAAFYPTITLGAEAGMQATNLGLLDLPNDFWSIGPSLSLPIFEGGLLRAKLGAAKAAFEEASERYRSTVLNAFQEIEDSLALLHWLEKEGQEQQAAARSAQQTLDMSMSLYKNGADSYLDVVTAQTSALVAERAVLALQTRRVQASIQLIRALGGGWSTDQLPDIKAAANLTSPK